MDVRKLVQKQALLEETLLTSNPAGVAITSIEHPNLTEHKPGVTFEVPASVAARMIVRATHRRSTEAEVEAWHADLELRNEKQRQKNFERQINSGNVAIIQDGRLVRPETPSSMQITTSAAVDAAAKAKKG